MSPVSARRWNLTFARVRGLASRAVDSMRETRIAQNLHRYFIRGPIQLAEGVRRIGDLFKRQLQDSTKPLESLNADGSPATAKASEITLEAQPEGVQPAGVTWKTWAKVTGGTVGTTLLTVAMSPANHHTTQMLSGPSSGLAVAAIATAAFVGIGAAVKVGLTLKKMTPEERTIWFQA